MFEPKSISASKKKDDGGGEDVLKATIDEPQPQQPVDDSGALPPQETKPINHQQKDGKPPPLKDGVNQQQQQQQEAAKSKRIRIERLTKLVYETCQRGLERHGYHSSLATSFLAEGAFGAVFTVKKLEKIYAVKIFSDQLFDIKLQKNMTTEKMISRFHNEVALMKHIGHHPNIIGLIDYFEDDQILPPETIEDDLQLAGLSYETVFKNCFIIMEYADSKTLSCYLRRRRHLNENVAKKVFREIVGAVRYLHQIKIAHRDLKLSNILLQRINSDTSSSFPYTAKICDFGLSSVADPYGFLKAVGTSQYMSPEILRSYYFYFRKEIDMIVPYCAFKSDIWALGVCLYYSLHGIYPLGLVCLCSRIDRMVELERIFESEKLFNEKINNQNYHFNEEEYQKFYYKNIQTEMWQCSSKLSSECRDLISRMLNVDKDQRADIEEIYQHKFFLY